MLLTSTNKKRPLKSGTVFVFVEVGRIELPSKEKLYACIYDA
jgi:hypothetical protein